MNTDKKIKFGESVEIIFPDGDSFVVNAEDIAETMSKHFEIYFHELLSPTEHHNYSIGASNTYKHRKLMAQKYIKDNEV